MAECSRLKPKSPDKAEREFLLPENIINNSVVLEMEQVDRWMNFIL